MGSCLHVVNDEVVTHVRVFGNKIQDRSLLFLRLVSYITLVIWNPLMAGAECTNDSPSLSSCYGRASKIISEMQWCIYPFGVLYPANWCSHILLSAREEGHHFAGHYFAITLQVKWKKWWQSEKVKEVICVMKAFLITKLTAPLINVIDDNTSQSATLHHQLHWWQASRDKLFYMSNIQSIN